MDIVDVVIHVDPELAESERTRMEEEISQHSGVVSVHFSHEHTHLMTVAYDPKLVSSDDILSVVGNRGVHAEKIGL